MSVTNWHWLKMWGLGFYGGPKKPAIEGAIDVGHGKMQILVVLTDDMLVELARLAPIILAEPSDDQRGHAFWHWRNPEREYPCNECSAAVKQAKEKWAKRIDPPALGAATPTEGHSAPEPCADCIDEKADYDAANPPPWPQPAPATTGEPAALEWGPYGSALQTVEILSEPCDDSSIVLRAFGSGEWDVTYNGVANDGIVGAKAAAEEYARATGMLGPRAAFAPRLSQAECEALREVLDYASCFKYAQRAAATLAPLLECAAREGGDDAA